MADANLTKRIAELEAPERLGDVAWLLALDGRLPKHMPRRFGDSRPHLLRRPVEQPALALVVPVRLMLGNGDLGETLQRGGVALAARLTVVTKALEPMADRREQPAAERAFARIVVEAANGPRHGREHVRSRHHADGPPLRIHDDDAMNMGVEHHAGQLA